MMRTERATLALLVVLGGAATARAESGQLNPPLRVAAASDLALAFRDIGALYAKGHGRAPVFTFGSTGLLAQQLIHGTTYDLFASANISFAEDTAKAGVCSGDSLVLYARGRIVVWTRHGTPRVSLVDLRRPAFRRIAIANPEQSPYGRAAVEALKRARIYEAVRPRLVYGENVQQTLQLAASGNAEAAVVALSLATVSDGEYTPIDASLHAPIDQAMVLCGHDPSRLEAADEFRELVASPEGRAVMRRYGYLLPGDTAAEAR
jgi:molybdate transport system substrate-binding protein